MRGFPSGVTSAITERVGLKLMLIARSSVSATNTATPSRLSIPKNDRMLSMLGSASSIEAAKTPPISMNGRLLPPQNQTLSLIRPMMTWPKIPARGPAAHTIPTSWMSRLYLVVRIQLSAEIWTESANPIAVEGRLMIA